MIAILAGGSVIMTICGDFKDELSNALLPRGMSTPRVPSRRNSEDTVLVPARYRYPTVPVPVPYHRRTVRYS